jgi:hypothetical protein
MHKISYLHLRVKVISSHWDRDRCMMSAEYKVYRRGQAMVEYMVVACMFVLAISVLAVFLYAFRENSGRILDLMASDYP